MKNKALILFIIGVVSALIVFSSTRTPRTSKVAETGYAVSDFALLDSGGKRVMLSEMKGSVVFINFWATWCDSCVQEIPSMERLYRHFSGNPGFKIVTILFKDDLNTAIGFMRQNGYTFPVYLNPDESAAKMFGITAVPETFIIDKKGVLRDKVIGPAEWDAPDVIQEMQGLVNEP